MHPLGLCNNNDEEDLYEYGWVGVVKLEQPELDPSCLTVLGKVKSWMFYRRLRNLVFVEHLLSVFCLLFLLFFFLFFLPQSCLYNLERL